MTKVVHIQCLPPSGICAAMRLHKGFLKAGIDSVLISINPDFKGNEKVICLRRKARIIAQIDSKIQSYLTRKKIKEFGNFSYPVIGSDISKMEEIRNADFIYIHWALNGFLSLRNMAQLASLKKPVIFFLHDMWFITGGCHHSFECEKYKTGCGDCPMFPGHKKHDLSFREFSRKLKFYSSYDNIYFVALSQWMYNCAKQSALTKNKVIFHIPNFLDSTPFSPIDKKAARQMLDIDIAETVLAFGAVSITDPYKGWNYLKKAFSLLYQKKGFENVSVLIFGSGFNQEITDAIPFKTKFLGYLLDEYSTALVYNAADVIITPSLAETFGYVVLEALSCKTPVVGFDVGGIPELIRHKKNGYLARYKDAEDLAAGIQYCLQNHVMGYQPDGFDPENIIKMHLELFDYINSHKRDDSKPTF